MKRLLILSIGLLLAYAPGKGGPARDVQAAGTDRGGTCKEALRPDIHFGKIPLHFMANKGQVNEKAKFYAKASRYTLWLTKQGLVFDSIKTPNHPAHSPYSPYSPHSPKTVRDVSRLLFLDANGDPEMVPIKETKLKVNYFKGKDKSEWHCDIPTSKAVLYKSLYKNIDLKVYGIEKAIEYDWIVKPGGNHHDIRFAYKSVKGTRLDKQGNLLIETDFGQLMHKRPVAYQRIGREQGARSREKKEGRRNVDVQFKKFGKNTYGFEMGEYDKSRELIIDPVVLVYSTYLGGGNGDWGHGIAVDGSGCVYVTGYTFSSDFPTLNEYQADMRYCDDVFITKLDTTKNGASSLIYSTYLGGSYDDYGYGIAVDGSGCAYVTGATESSDFPTLNQYQAASQGYSDAFLTKLDTTKSGISSLIYSTYLGGSHHESGWGMAVDGSGCAYVTGGTSSTDFPTLNEYQENRGRYDVFLTKLDTTKNGAASLIYSTYLGGDSWDYGWGIAVDDSGCVYVTGYTYSWDFPTRNEYQAYQGSNLYPDAFITKLDTTKNGASSLIYSTFLGGDSSDEGRGIAVDDSGCAYVTGKTESSDFPTRNHYQAEMRGIRDVFLTKLDTTKNGASSLIYSTYLGGSDEDYGLGIAVDGSGCAYVTGSTSSWDFPTRNEYQAYQGGNLYTDAFITKLNTFKNGASCLIYSTYLGGSYDDYGYGIAVDDSGSAYVTGSTYSWDFPTQDEYQAYRGGYLYPDVFLTKMGFQTVETEPLPLEPLPRK